MSNYEFMFTKNFNSKISCSFKPAQSVLVAPDSSIASDLIGFARFGFDLTELYARKLRRDVYVNKAAFSNPGFFQQLFEENQRQLSERHTAAVKKTNLGRDHEKLKVRHQEVLNEISELAEFCKECKPSKKK